MADAQLLFCRETLKGLREALALAGDATVELMARLDGDALGPRAVAVADELETYLARIARLHGRLVPPSREELFRQMAAYCDDAPKIHAIRDTPRPGLTLVHPTPVEDIVA